MSMMNQWILEINKTASTTNTYCTSCVCVCVDTVITVSAAVPKVTHSVSKLISFIVLSGLYLLMIIFDSLEQSQREYM